MSPKWIHCQLTEMIISSIRKIWERESSPIVELSSPGIKPRCSALEAEIVTTAWTRPTYMNTDLYINFDFTKGCIGCVAVQNVKHHHKITNQLSSTASYINLKAVGKNSELLNRFIASCPSDMWCQALASGKDLCWWWGIGTDSLTRYTYIHSLSLN